MSGASHPAAPWSHPSGRLSRRWFVGCFVALAMGQAFIGFMGAGDRFVLGHNGWNSSAYLQSARNTLRWGTLFPVQYYTGRTPPTVQESYTHHPLGMHLHNVAAVWLFGDHEGSIRAVPAFFGVLALMALILVVRLLYDDRTALVAGGIYLLLPTNAIYANMSNHENGFIFWTCLWLYAYLKLIAARVPEDDSSDAAGSPPGLRSVAPRRWLGWYVFMLVAFFWAAMWDWPAYYCALACALHWLAVIGKRYRESGARGQRSLRHVRAEVALLAGFSALVLGLFVGHFLLVQAMVGSLGELSGVFEARQLVSRGMILHHLLVVPPLMFTLPLIVAALGWLGHRVALAVKRRFPRRDLLAFTFAVAGLLHYYIFRGTAVIHEYWGWTLLPFVAIVGARVLFAVSARTRAFLARRFPRRERLTAALALMLAVLLVTGNLVYRFVEFVPRGRAVGGSLWFIERTRPVIESYPSTREMIRFAAAVHDRTTRKTGVLVDPALRTMRGYEPRFAITLDREVVVQSVRSPPPTMLGIDGWVYVAPPGALADKRLVELAASHPLFIYDDYVMVDLRRYQREVTVWRSAPCVRDGWTWYWGGPWADAVEPVDLPDEEARLLRAAEDLRAGRRAAP